MSTPQEFDYDDVVAVINGKYKGTVGLYDDDESQNRIVIYPGVWMYDDCIVVPRRYCRLATKEETEQWRWTFDNDIAVQRARNKFTSERKVG